MKLTAAARKRIPAHNFALPGGRYPIEDISHARAALSMDHNATPAERVTIEHKVHLKYPSIGKQAGDRGGDSAGGVMGQYGARMEIDGNQGGGQYGARMRMKKAAGGAGDVGKARMRPILSTLAAFGHQGGPKAKGSPQFGARMAGTQATGARMPAVHPRMHALAMASATHLRNLGHLSDAQHEQIHMQATRHLQAGKTLNKAPGVTKQASPFGTLAPQAPSPGAPAGALGAIGSGVGSSMASGTQPTAPSYSPGLRQGRVQPPWERG
jgi:hypothetical protein